MPRRGRNNNRRRRKRTRRPQNNGPKNTSGVHQSEFNSLNASHIPRSLQGSTPFPTFMIRRLAYMDPTFVLQGASPYRLREFRLNDIWDPDPLLGGGSVSGYTQLISIYNFWRVEGFRFRFEVVSNEPAVPVLFGGICRDVQPSTTIGSYADAQNSLEVAPTTGPHMVGQTSGNSVFRSRWYSCAPATIQGNPLTYMGDQGAVGGDATSPGSVLWFAFVLLSAIGGNLTNGAIVTVYLNFTVRFFSLKNTLASRIVPLHLRDEQFHAI